jgi:hypothetical protein
MVYHVVCGHEGAQRFSQGAQFAVNRRAPRPQIRRARERILLGDVRLRAQTNEKHDRQ